MKRILKKSVIIDTNMIEILFFRNNFSISLQSIYLGKEGLFIEEWHNSQSLANVKVDYYEVEYERRFLQNSDLKDI